MVHVDLIVRDHPAALQRLRQAFRLPHLPDERHADDVRARLDRHADLQPRVAVNLHVLFPGVVAGKARRAVAGVTGRGRPALRLASDGEPFQQPAVEADVELLRPSHALEVVLILPLEPDLEEVLAGDGKVAANRDAAARPERQILALPIVLHHMQGNLESLDRRTRGRQTRREPRDLASHRHVALQVGGRNREDIREIVEAAVRGVVSGQQRFHVEVEREQVANRVAIFGAIEAMDRGDPAGIRSGRPGPIDVVLQRGRHRVIGGGIGTRPSGRRHRTGSKLRDHFFPDLRIRAGPCHVQVVERKSGGTESLVVAADAVGVEDRLRGGRGSGAGRRRRLRLSGRGRDAGERHGDRAAEQEREERCPHVHSVRAFVTRLPPAVTRFRRPGEPSWPAFSRHCATGTGGLSRRVPIRHSAAWLRRNRVRQASPAETVVVQAFRPACRADLRSAQTISSQALKACTPSIFHTL